MDAGIFTPAVRTNNLLIAMGFAVAMIDPPMVMLGIALTYAASGPAKTIWKKLQRGT